MGRRDVLHVETQVIVTRERSESNGLPRSAGRVDFPEQTCSPIEKLPEYAIKMVFLPEGFILLRHPRMLEHTNERFVHKIVNGESSGLCSKCLLWKPRHRCHRDKYAWDGLNPKCKGCRRKVD